MSLALRCGCNPCPDDAQGDASVEDLLGAAPEQLSAPPAALNLKHLVYRIRNQGSAGTCVGFGVTQAAACCARSAGFPIEDLSALATYVQARGLTRQLKSLTDGTTITAAIEALTRGGYLLESEMPYDPSLRRKGLKFGAGQKGLKRCGMRAHRIDTSMPIDQFILTVKQLLSGGKGVVGGWQVDDPFEAWTPDKGPWDGIVGPSAGGHCMDVLDYPDGLPRIVNSWGEDRGDHGFWQMTWNAVRKATSLWAIDYIP